MTTGPTIAKDMLPTVHQVFGSLEPYAIIADLHLPWIERDGDFFTLHPQFEEHEFQIQGRDFIGAEHNSPTPGCNLFDFLALHFDSSYAQAVDYLIARFFNLARVPPGVELDSLRQSFIDNLEFKRKQFEDILALREPFRTHSPHLAGAYTN